MNIKVKKNRGVKLDTTYNRGRDMEMIMNAKDWANALYQSLGIFMCFYKEEKDRFLYSPDVDLDLYRLFELSGMKDQLKDAKTNINQPLSVSNSINCIWITIPTLKEQEFDRCIIGPTLINSISKEQIIKYYCQNGLSIEEAALLSKEYEKIPIIPYEFLIQLYPYFYYVLVGKKTKYFNLGTSQTINSENIIHINEEEIYHKQQRNFAMQIEVERFLLDCVRCGKVDLLKERSPNFNIDTSFLGPNKIRSLKNTFITAITKVTCAAIEGGLLVEIAFPLSDKYILQIELVSEIILLIELYHKAILEFTSRVKNNKSKVNYSKIISQICGYILSNVNNPLQVYQIAKAFSIHPDTLSKKFKLETGVPITEYIRNTKIEEAKMMLLHTDKSLTEISNLLSYSSQSQFIISFKRLTGTTPHKFRSQRK